MPSGPSGGPGSEPASGPGAEAPSATVDGTRVRFWRAGTIIRLVFALALTGLTFWMSDPSAVLAAARGAALLPLLGVIGLVAVDRGLTVQRWLVLLRPFTQRGAVAVGVVLRVFFVSTFVGTFLPAGVGSDAVRVVALSKYQIRGSEVLASVLVDRVIGVLSIVLAAVVGLALSPAFRSEPSVLAAVGLMSAGCLAASAFIFSERLQEWLGRVSRRLPPRSTMLVQRLTAALRAYASRAPALVEVLALSIVLQMLRVFQAYGIGISLGIAAPLTAYFAIIPVVLLVILLPISISGLGTTQVVFVWFFGQIGVGAPEAFALSVLYLALGVIGNLPGAFLYARRGLPDGRPDHP